MCIKIDIRNNAFLWFFLGINRLLSNGTYEAAFPPHEVIWLIGFLVLYLD